MTEVPVNQGSGESSGESSGKGSEFSLGKTALRIVALMRKYREITIPEIAERLGKTTRAIEKQVSRLKAYEVIGRVGPAKGGHWEVLK